MVKINKYFISKCKIFVTAPGAMFADVAKSRRSFCVAKCAGNEQYELL